MKPCSRCVLTTGSTEHGRKHPNGEPLRTLQAFRTADNGNIVANSSPISFSDGKVRFSDGKVRICAASGGSNQRHAAATSTVAAADADADA
ncbi:MAG: hypothetical protein G5701_05780 [Serratia symbiotica]|nr:hypothetical protein [Serratia symbiotica]